MILQSLTEQYWRLIEEGETKIPALGYSLVDVSFVLVLSEEGKLVDAYPVEIELLVPEHKKRQGVNPPPYFMCDKVMYSLGIAKDKAEGSKRFGLYREYNLRLLEKVKSVKANAVKIFLENWEPQNWENVDCIKKYSAEYFKPVTLNTVYKIDGENGYVHQDKEIIAAWETENKKPNKDDVIEQCLVSGEKELIAKTHEVGISGIGEKANAAVVSFNCDSFESYGKKQSYNAPVGRKAAFAYANALNYLLANKANRVRLADTTMVFWADKKGGKAEERILLWLLDPIEVEDEAAESIEERQIDPVAARQAKTILERVKNGLAVEFDGFNEDTRCYLLGLVPNAARLSVRFWQVSKFGDIVGTIATHYKDMDIVGMERVGGMVAPWRVLKSLAVQQDSKNIPPLLGGQFLKTILSGNMYPQTIFNATLLRCRTGGEHGGVTTIRAAILKAFLARKYRMTKQFDKEASITMGLNEENENQGYLLGRLFSVLEKAQKDALGENINATIRDRYFGSASATPRAVFPLLLRLSQHHISNPQAKYGEHTDRKIQAVMNQLSSFPSHLNMDDQGMFILGYYHQNQANYAKKEKSNEELKG